MNKRLNVPKGKHTVGVWVTGHSYVRLMNSEGEETFRFESPGKHITAVVQPGRLTVDTDGKLGKVELASLPPHLRTRREADATKPPRPKAVASRRKA